MGGITEGFRVIVATEGNEDEAEIHKFNNLAEEKSAQHSWLSTAAAAGHITITDYNRVHCDTNDEI